MLPIWRKGRGAEVSAMAGDLEQRGKEHGEGERRVRV